MGNVVEMMKSEIGFQKGKQRPIGLVAIIERRKCLWLCYYSVPKYLCLNGECCRNDEVWDRFSKGRTKTNWSSSNYLMRKCLWLCYYSVPKYLCLNGECCRNDEVWDRFSKGKTKTKCSSSNYLMRKCLWLCSTTAFQSTSVGAPALRKQAPKDLTWSTRQFEISKAKQFIVATDWKVLFLFVCRMLQRNTEQVGKNG